MENSSVRIDKFLWAVRLFKTRSQAADACKKGRVLINERAVKPSREIKVADVFVLRKSPVNYKYRVKELLTNRVGAKLVENYLENITPKEELFKLEVEKNMPYFKRDRGTGRPTKKDRRDIDRLYS
ncbi:MAG: RNA-binding S4 domain-containing protein [Bacteroidales bacterium]|nr:RNA-binding S4 domain-containing protein [Bacteroidales bacterium]